MNKKTHNQLDLEPTTNEGRIKLYEHLIEKLKTNHEYNLEIFFGKNLDDTKFHINYDLSVHKPKESDSEPFIVLKIDKNRIRDYHDVSLYRTSLFTQLEDIEPMFEWGICRTNQIYEFPNYFEIFPELKRKYTLEEKCNTIEETIEGLREEILSKENSIIKKSQKLDLIRKELKIKI